MSRMYKYTIAYINSIRPATCKMTAIKFIKRRTRYGHRLILAKCDLCGIRKEIQIAAITMGKYFSCGCQRNRSKRKYIQSHPLVLRSWQSMIARCYNITNSSYPSYGRVGVRVCDEWRTDYDAYLVWSLNNG